MRCDAFMCLCLFVDCTLWWMLSAHQTHKKKEYYYHWVSDIWRTCLLQYRVKCMLEVFFMILLKTHTLDIHTHWTYTHTKQRPILPQFINVSIWLCVQLIKVMIMKLFNCVHHARNNGMGRIEHVVGVLLIAFLVFPLQNWIWRQKLAKLKYKPSRAVWLCLKCVFVIQTVQTLMIVLLKCREDLERMLL